ncbi:MAG: S16 family serine protease, partial [Pyrinomonadaceae bacterium]
GIRRIVLPARNEADTEKIPEDVRKDLEIIGVTKIGEALDATLEKLVSNPPPEMPAPSVLHEGGNSRTEPEAMRVREG